MERLYRQRMAYLRSDPEGGCFLCAGAATADRPSDLVLHRSPLCVVVMNRYPYNSGHLLVAPARHTGWLENLTQDEQLDLMALTKLSVAVLTEALAPDGFNVGVNLGTAGGAGLPEHLHWHVVPRWSADTNFMPVLAGAKVLPETLDQTYERLRPLFDQA